MLQGSSLHLGMTLKTGSKIFSSVFELFFLIILRKVKKVLFSKNEFNARLTMINFSLIFVLLLSFNLNNGNQFL
mgnify:CR=1 FL=1